MAEGPNFSATFTGDDLGALNGPLPTHSFQKVRRAMGGMFPAGRSPTEGGERKGGERKGEGVTGSVLEEGRLSGEEGTTAGTQTSDNQFSGSTSLKAWGVHMH